MKVIFDVRIVKKGRRGELQTGLSSGSIGSNGSEDKIDRIRKEEEAVPSHPAVPGRSPSADGRRLVNPVRHAG